MRVWRDLPGRDGSNPECRRNTNAAMMKSGRKQAGIRNYSIWSDGSEVFGYYECEQGVAFAEKTQAGSPVVDCWNDYMQDVLELEMDPETGAQPKLRQMFLME